MGGRFLRGARALFLEGGSGLFVQLFRYSIVGGAAAICDIGVFALLTNVLSVNHIVANTVSFVVGLFVNFLLSRSWVFGSRTKVLSGGFVVFGLIGAVGVALSDFILFLLVDLGAVRAIFRGLEDPEVKLVAKLAAVLIVLSWNFFARKALVFRALAQPRVPPRP